MGGPFLSGARATEWKRRFVDYRGVGLELSRKERDVLDGEATYRKGLGVQGRPRGGHA